MATLTVGAVQQFQTIASAVAAAQDGDTVAVQAGTYTNDFAEITHRIKLTSVGGLANLVATVPIPNGKAILITDTDITIDGFAFSGATVADGNGAGIRYQGGRLVIANSVFHDNQNGILAANDPAGTIAILNSEFNHNGAGDGYTHGIYVGDIKSLVIDGSYFHDAVVGHEIKSRAESTTIRNSRVEDGANGSASYTVDLPNGGAALITGSTLEKGPNSQNPIVVAFGEEGNLHANSSLTLQNNTLIYDRFVSASSNFVRNSSGVDAALVGNRTFGLPADQVLRGPGSVTGSVELSSAPTPDTSTPLTPAPLPAGTPLGDMLMINGSTTDASRSAASGVAPDGSGPAASGVAAVFRFFDSRTGTQFLTTSLAERATVLATRPDLTSEGTGFGALTADDGAAAPVFRFFDTGSGTHFYTTSAAERDQTQATRSDLRYEGVAFREHAAEQPGTVPVYRFFDSGQGTHFYTGSASERAAILATRPDLIGEGIAFYAPS